MRHVALSVDGVLRTPKKKVKVVHKGLRIRSGLPRETNEKIEKERKIEKKRTTQYLDIDID